MKDIAYTAYARFGITLTELMDGNNICPGTKDDYTNSEKDLRKRGRFGTNFGQLLVLQVQELIYFQLSSKI